MSADTLTCTATSTVSAPPRERTVKAWAWLWPKVMAIGIVLLIWQSAVWSGARPEYVLPPPQRALDQLWENVTTERFWSALQTTMGRGLTGYALALLIGSLIGIAVVQWRPVRMGVASMITGMQTMPSIAWFPLAILLFGVSETAILFVVVLGAAPSIANGIITGIDEVPPPYLRVGHMLGVRAINRYRYVVIPAALPAYVAGLKQGWAFSWRSLMAGELLVVIAERPSLGSDLTFARTTGNAPQLMALMIVLLVIGMIIDGLFSSFSNRMRAKRGLTGLSAA